MGPSKETFMPEAGIAFSSRNLGKKEINKPERPHLGIKMNGFEPFINPEPPPEGSLFVTGYNGNFAQAMVLNRKAIERVLKIAHLDGQVFLTSLAPNRQRSLDANPDGSVSVKRFLVFGEKIEEDEKENPYCKVTSVPQGWKIEINDTRVRDELMKKGNGNVRDIQKPFIQRFNGQLNQALWKCIYAEKLSGKKDKHIKIKVFGSLFPILPALITIRNLSLTTFSDLMVIVSTYAICNMMGEVGMRRYKRNEEAPRRSSFFFFSRDNLDNFWEYFMPMVEIDKVARSYAFLGVKGRTLVREIKTEK